MGKCPSKWKFVRYRYFVLDIRKEISAQVKKTPCPLFPLLSLEYAHITPSDWITAPNVERIGYGTCLRNETGSPPSPSPYPFPLPLYYFIGFRYLPDGLSSWMLLERSIQTASLVVIGYPDKRLPLPKFPVP